MYEAHGGGGEPEVQPNVYHPQTVAAPSYEEYADPAAAHGWQNAYDETRELPALSGPPGSGGPRVPGGPDGGRRAPRPQPRGGGRAPAQRGRW
ncbi:hypothetical protein ACFXOG_06660, partial [Streptomyces sp. NPDC059168]